MKNLTHARSKSMTVAAVGFVGLLVAGLTGLTPLAYVAAFVLSWALSFAFGVTVVLAADRVHDAYVAWRARSAGDVAPGVTQS